jgi:hypothetical protein
MKDTYYFQHDYEPTSDPKMVALLGDHGAVGYGIYWRIVEMLHSDTEHKLPHKKYIYLALAKQMLTSVEQIEAIVNFAIQECELLKSDGEYFWSDRVIRNIERRNDISKKRSKAGKASARAKQVLTSVEQNSTNANKGKERKVKEIYIYPKSADAIKKHLESDYNQNPGKYNILKLRDMAYVAELYFNDRSSKEWQNGEQPIRRWQNDAVNYSLKCDSNGGFPKREKTLREQIEELPRL